MPPPVRHGALGIREHFRRRTARWRVLPDFVIVGTHKGGTTSLYDYVTSHPQVVPASEKEVHYFDHRYDGRENTYRQSFPLAARMDYVGWRNGRALTGEASPYYLSHPHIPARAAAMIPQGRFIALLRNPVDRAVSAFQHNRRRTQREPLTDFEDAVTREMNELSGEYERLLSDEHYPDQRYASHCYLMRGAYVRHLERWYQYVPSERLLVLQSERLGSDPEAVYAEVLEFLGLSPWTPVSFRRLNENSYPDVGPELRAELMNWFRPHNERLFELLGTEFNWS